MRLPRVLALALAGVCLAAAPAAAQAVTPPRIAVRDSTRPRVAAPLAALMSAALPGAGEYALHLDRWVPQLAAEAFAWWQYRAHRRDARSLEAQYRRLACQVARRGDPAAFVAPGVCRDSSDFEYYETMGKPFWPRSGSFDSDPNTPGIQPETDSAKFNGYIWARAKALYPASQEAALAYYEKHGIPAGYLWDWGDNGLEQTVYDELIHRGDQAFRTSSRFMGFILANHIASAVDAYIAARLRELPRGPAIEVQTGFEPEGDGVRWRAGVRIGTGPR